MEAISATTLSRLRSCNNQLRFERHGYGWVLAESGQDAVHLVRSGRAALCDGLAVDMEIWIAEDFSVAKQSVLHQKAHKLSGASNNRETRAPRSRSLLHGSVIIILNIDKPEQRQSVAKRRGPQLSGLSVSMLPVACLLGPGPRIPDNKECQYDFDYAEQDIEVPAALECDNHN
jgi:hypothetical protein